MGVQYLVAWRHSSTVSHRQAGRQFSFDQTNISLVHFIAGTAERPFFPFLHSFFLLSPQGGQSSGFTPSRAT